MILGLLGISGKGAKRLYIVRGSTLLSYSYVPQVLLKPAERVASVILEEIAHALTKSEIAHGYVFYGTFKDLWNRQHDKLLSNLSKVIHP